MKKLVIYHCDNDGFGAAYACWLNFGEEAEYISAQYNQPLPEIPNGVEEIYIVDISYSREVCDSLASKYKLTILDHHKTAYEILKDTNYAVFDLEHSAAVLVFKYLFPHKEIPAILSYVEDYDLWKFQLNKSKEVNLYIDTLVQFEEWDEFELSKAIEGGTAIRKFRDRQVNESIKNSNIIEFEGYKVVLLNATENVSTVGNELLKKYKADFSITYRDVGSKRYYSLRSIGDFDVSVIAKKYGGGGHKNASGFAKDIIVEI